MQDSSIPASRKILYLKPIEPATKKHLVTGNERKLEAAKVTSKIWMEEDLKEE